MNRHKIALLFSIFIFSNCTKKVSEAELEQNVFDKIFLKVVDSTYRDKRLYTFYPFPGMENDNAEFQRQRENLKKDTINLVIAIDENERKIDFDKFESKKFLFKKLSEISEDYDYVEWEKRYPKFVGVMSFSKITFDEDKKTGKLNVSYNCGGKCGLGYIVHIAKENDSWRIVRVENTWIS